MNPARTTAEPAGAAPKRVAVVYHYFAHYRGPVMGLLCQPQRGGHEYTLFSDKVPDDPSIKLIDPAKADQAIEQGGLRWKWLRNHWYKVFLWQSGMVRLALSAEYDCIIFLGSMYFFSTWVGAVLARLSGKRVLFWTHGFYGNESWLKQWVRILFLRLPHGLLLYGCYARELLLARRFASESLYVIYNSLDYEQQRQLRGCITAEARAELRARMFKHAEQPVVLFIGRLIPAKKLEMILGAVQRFKAENKIINGLFVGDGPEMEALRARAQQLGIADQVHFYGPCYDETLNAKLIGLSDVVVSPGNIGLTAIHAMAYGTPVITHGCYARQGPEFEAVQPHHTGLFFVCDDVESLAKTIREWFDENIDRETVRQNCYKVVDENYNPHVQVEVINQAVSGIPAKDLARRFPEIGAGASAKQNASVM